MTTRATGPFDVKLTPQPFEGAPEGVKLGRMTIDKQFRGELDGTFVLQHTGTMTRGTPSLSITVVPDSGTGALTGLTGTMAIIMTDGTHAYEFDYALPIAAPG